MKVTFTRVNTEQIVLEDSDLREIIPNLNELDFDEIEEVLNKYLYNKDLEENYGLSMWGEKTIVKEIKD